jgi:hypothetical protein
LLCHLAGAFSNRSWRFRGGRECWVSIVTLTFGTTRTALLSAPTAGRILPQGNSLELISVMGWIWTTVLLNAARRNGSVENSHRPYKESNPEPPVLWRRILSSGTVTYCNCPCRGLRVTSHLGLAQS